MIKDIVISGYPQQEEFIHSDVPELLFVGGVGSGKTTAGAMKSLDMQLKYPGASLIVTAPTYRIMNGATLLKYQEIYPPELIKKQRSRPYPEWELVTGGHVFFYSTEQPQNIVGGEVAFVHMDEASLSPIQAYTNCKKRMRQRDDKGNVFPYQIWVTTTPRQLNWLYLEFYKNQLEGHKLIKASTRDNVYRNASDIDAYIEKMGLSELEYSQEIEGNFEILAGDCLFRKEDLDKQMENILTPIESRPNGTIIYSEPVFGRKLVAAADCSDEGGGGANDMIIQDPQTGQEVAEVYTEESIDKFAEACYELLKEYHYPLFAPERNGTVGGIMIEKFLSMGYENLYKDSKDKYGWYTMSATTLPPQVGRFQMLKEYEEAVRTRQVIIRSSDAIGEMSTCIRDGHGKYKHLEGCKDDRIMARAICWQIRNSSSKPNIGFSSFKRTTGTY